MEKTALTLGDDQPKKNPWQDDRLGYRSFAERLSKVIISLHAPYGYVIGLHGKWGSGKSTALNFINAFIEKHNAETECLEDRVSIIDFRPWMVSGHRDLIAAFFKILSENLCPKENGRKRLSKRLLRMINGATDDAVDAAAKVALLVDPSGGVASGFAGAVAKKSVNGLVGRFLEDPSLQSAYEDLIARLEQKNRRFLVQIDDLDRLDADEVRSIAQMVKTVGRLPNVVYVLAYDREIVWQSLDVHVPQGGPRYAEKIVQQEIELPKPSRNALLSILDQQVDFLGGELSSSLRWQYILRDGVHRWIQSPRDVLRLSNAVKFSWPALAGEIDPQDLLAMEGLRLFDEQAYYWVRESRDFIFNEGRFHLALEGVREASVASLKERLPRNYADQLLHILGVLFPTTSKWLHEDAAFSRESSAELARRRGIGSEAGYDAYFSLQPSVDEIPKAVIDGLVENIDDEGFLKTTLAGYLHSRNSRGEPMVSKVLQELRYRYESREAPPPTRQMLNALLEIGEDTIGTEWNAEIFILSPRAHWSFVVDSMLGLWGVQEGGRQLIDAFESATSAAACAEIFVSRGRELGVFKAESTQVPLISREHFEALGPILLSKIHKSRDDGSLAEAPFYFDVVRSWSYLEDTESPKEWLESGMRASARFLAKVGRGLVVYSTSEGFRYYTFKEWPDANLYDLEVILVSARAHKEDSDLNDDDRRLIVELERGAKALLAGDVKEGEN